MMTEIISCHYLSYIEDDDVFVEICINSSISLRLISVRLTSIIPVVGFRIGAALMISCGKRGITSVAYYITFVWRM